MNRKLPVWQIFTKALSLVWEKRGFALRVSWPVLLATIMLAVVFVRDSAPIYYTGANRPDVPRFTPLYVTFVVIQAFFMAIVAVYWHRNVLLQETQAPAVPLRFDGALWRYVGYVLVLGLMMVGFVVMTASSIIPLASVGVPKELGVPLLIALAIGLMVIPLRCSLALPAVAVGRKGFGLGQSWVVTRGNTLRLLALHLLLFAVAFVVGFVLGFLRGLLGVLVAGSAFWLKISSDFVTNWVVMLIGLSVLSLSYAYLTWELPPQDARTEG